MAGGVSFSPFGKKAKSNEGTSTDANGNTIYTDAQGHVTILKAAGSGSSGKYNLDAEIQKLQTTKFKTQVELAKGDLKASEAAAATNQIFNIGEGKGIGGAIGRQISGGTGAMARAIKTDLGWLGSGLSAIQKYVTDPVVRDLSSVTTEAIHAGKALSDYSSGYNVKESDKPSWDRYVKNANTPGYRSFSEGSDYYVKGNWGKVLNLAEDIVYDPTTYLTLGAGTSSAAGRLALATEFATEDMLIKYPEMASKLGNVARYGATEIPLHIRQAEGITAGVKFFGAEVPYTDGLAKAWRYTVSEARAGVGDVIYKGLGEGGTNFITKAKMLPAVESGIFREAGINATNHQFISAVAERSAGYAGRGVRGHSMEVLSAEELNHLTALSAAETLGDKTVENITHAIETPALRSTLSPQAQHVLDSFVSWKDNAYNRLNERMQAMGKRYGLDINNLSVLDDHMYHQLTTRAKQDVFGKNGKARSFFSSLTANDVIEGRGVASFRKYTKGSKFMNETLQEGTIAEINAIFKRQMKVDYNFFETDLRIVSSGYKESIARLEGRVAYVSRAMEFGPDFVKPLISKVVRDDQLINKLTQSTTLLQAAQKRIMGRIKRGIGTAANKTGTETQLRNATEFITSILDGRYMQRQAIDAETARLVADMDKVIAQLDNAKQYAMTLTADQRAHYADVHMAMYTEAHAYRQALLDGHGERFMALKQARAEYVKLYPNAAGSEMDGKSLEWFAEKIDRGNNGGEALTTAQFTVLKNQEKDLISVLDSMPKNADNQAAIAAKEEELTIIRAQIDGQVELNAAKANATYASQGVMYGFVPDPEAFGTPFHMWTTAAPADADGTFRRMEDSLIAHATPEELLIDPRKVEHMAAIVGTPDLAQSIGTFWGSVGMPDYVWNDIVHNAYTNGVVDNLVWEKRPEKAFLLDGILRFNKVVEKAKAAGEDISPEEIQNFFDWFKASNRAVLAKTDRLNSDAVTESLMQHVFQQLTNDGKAEGFVGVLAPMKTFVKDAPHGEWAVLIHKGEGAPVVGHRFVNEVQFVKDNPLAASIMDGTQEAYQLGLFDHADELAKAGIDIQNVLDSRIQMQNELFGVQQKTAGTELAIKAKALNERLVTVNGKQYPESVVRSNLSKIEDKIDGAYAKIDADVAKTTEDEFGVGALQRQRLSLEDHIKVQYANADALNNWTPQFEQGVVNDVAEMVLHLQRIPDAGASRGANAAWIRETEKILQNSSLFTEPAVKEAYDKVVKLTLANTVDLAKVEGELTSEMFKLSQAQAGITGRFAYDEALKGWTAIQQLGVQMPEEVVNRWLPNIKKLTNQAEAGKFSQSVKRVNDYWKRYVTSSVGFFVRNGYSGTFMNYADGVTNAHIMEGTQWAWVQSDIVRSAEKKYTKTGKSFGNWMERAGIDVNDPKAVEEANKVMEVVFATGRGSTSDAAVPVVNRWKATKWMDNNKITKDWRLGDNPYLNFFSGKNDNVERALRIPMALDSIRRGDTIDQAIARIQHIHFDYGDVSKLDEKAKRWVPFWIWGSRNVPLQISQQITHPKAYYEYNKVKSQLPIKEDDLSTTAKEGMILPAWMRTYGPMGVGAGSLLKPDLPQVRLSQQIQGFLDPTKLLGQTIPMVKVPIETYFLHRQTGLDVGPFKPTEARGYEKYVAKLVQALSGNNYIKIDKSNNITMPQEISYIIEQALPPLSQINRLTGGRTGGKDSLNERWLSSVLSWFGIPYQGIGNVQAYNEVRRREFDYQNLTKQLKDVSTQNQRAKGIGITP